MITNSTAQWNRFKGYLEPVRGIMNSRYRRRSSGDRGARELRPEDDIIQATRV